MACISAVTHFFDDSDENSSLVLFTYCEKVVLYKYKKRQANNLAKQSKGCDAKPRVLTDDSIRMTAGCITINANDSYYLSIRLTDAFLLNGGHSYERE